MSRSSHPAREAFWEAVATQTPLFPFVALVSGKLEPFTTLELIEATAEPFLAVSWSTPSLFRIAIKAHLSDGSIGLALILIDLTTHTFVDHSVHWTYRPRVGGPYQGVISEKLPYMRMRDSIEGRRHFVRAMRIVQRIQAQPDPLAQEAARVLHAAITNHCKRMSSAPKH